MAKYRANGILHLRFLKSVFWRADKDATQIRRLARERREYIYRKSLEGKEKEQYEKKRKIWQALQEGKPIPTELREDELNIRKELELEGSLTARARYLVILISSCKSPSLPRGRRVCSCRPRRSQDIYHYVARSLISPCPVFQGWCCRSLILAAHCSIQEVRLIFPNSQRVNRGNHVIKDLVEACRANDVTDIVILHEHRGEPGVSTCMAALIFFLH